MPEWARPPRWHEEEERVSICKCREGEAVHVPGWARWHKEEERVKVR